MNDEEILADGSLEDIMQIFDDCVEIIKENNKNVTDDQIKFCMSVKQLFFNSLINPELIYGMYEEETNELN